jgi:hypothetical protein
MWKALVTVIIATSKLGTIGRDPTITESDEILSVSIYGNKVILFEVKEFYRSWHRVKDPRKRIC